MNAQAPIAIADTTSGERVAIIWIGRAGCQSAIPSAVAVSEDGMISSYPLSDLRVLAPRPTMNVTEREDAARQRIVRDFGSPEPLNSDR